MSLRHKASRHSASSPSTTRQLFSATRFVLPESPLGPNFHKAKDRIIALEQQIGPTALQRFLVEARASEVVRVEAEQQAVAPIGRQREDVAGRTVDRHLRSDGDKGRLPRE